MADAFPHDDSLPYAAPERYPDSPAHRAYLERWNTRVVGRTLPPLELAVHRADSLNLRHAAAACQTDLPNPIDRAQMRVNTDRTLAMIDAAVVGSAPFLPVRLIVFPEFRARRAGLCHRRGAGPKLAVADPNEHTERLAAKAREARRLRAERNDDRGPARAGRAWSSTPPA